MANERIRVEPWPGAASINKRIPRGWFTRKMAGEEIGRSKDRIKDWEKNGDCAPDGYTVFGKTVVPLYSIEAVEKLKAVAKGKKSGRPPKQQQQEKVPHATGSDEGSRHV